MYISISSYTYTYRYIHIHINIYIHTSSTATTTMTHPHIHRGGGGTRNQRKSAASETSRAPPQPHNHRGGGDHDPSTGGGGGVGDAAPYIQYLCRFFPRYSLIFKLSEGAVPSFPFLFGWEDFVFDRAASRILDPRRPKKGAGCFLYPSHGNHEMLGKPNENPKNPQPWIRTNGRVNVWTCMKRRGCFWVFKKARPLRGFSDS